MSRVCLNPENASSIGDDTFWLWAKRALPGATFEAPQPGDCVLQYSTKGAAPAGVRGIGLLWELHPEMTRVFGPHWSAEMASIAECAASCAINVVPTALCASLYPDIPTTVVPIGVDFDLWRPMDRQECRERIGLPRDARIGMWCGTTHPMKGYDILQGHAGKADHWIIVWKSGTPAGPPLERPSTVINGTSQHGLAMMMGAADFYAVPGRLRPYFLIEYEAMAANLPLEVMGEPEKDFVATGSPRSQLKAMGWDRADCVAAWGAIL